jgi:Protein of unknown function (DUF2933)
MRCCFDKRVWIGLGVLAAGLLIADPRSGRVALPVLAGLACPVSMLFMMRGMRQGTGSTMAAPGGDLTVGAGRAEGDRAAEIARLRCEIRQLKAQAGDVALAAANAGRAAEARGRTREPGRARKVRHRRMNFGGRA